MPYHSIGVVIEKNQNWPGYESTQFSIGKNKEALSLLVDADKEVDDKMKSERVAEALDIPKTAIQAWSVGKIKDPETLPGDIKESDYYHFIDFALSEDHWKEELEVVRDRAEKIRQIVPWLYESTISSSKDN